MEKKIMSRPVDLKNVRVTDPFFKEKIELVRTEVIPYQWAALNDSVEGAAPSYAMHNFKAAARLNEKKHTDPDFKAPVFVERGFEMLPEDPANPDEDKFYGFVFQDSDFYKFVEAVAYSLTQHPDPVLQATCDEAIDIIARAQADDGYLDTYYILNGRDKEFSNLRDNHELYCFGHLVEAAVAYFQATGKNVLLQVAERYADYVSSKIGREPGKKRGYPGHEVAEMGLVRLYEVTGEEKYLRLAEYFIDERGQQPHYFDIEGHHNRPHNYENSDLPYAYFQAHLPVRKQAEALGHSVRAAYLYSGMADIARITGDEELFAACEALWKSVTREKMYITGSIGSTSIGEAFTFPFDLPNDLAYAESCAAIGLVFFARRMLEISPKSEYADVMEKCFYNGILSGIALDGKSFFYVNPLEVLPEAVKNDGRKKHVKPVRQKWFGCACCPPNIARILSSAGAYAYTENDNTLFVHLYMGSVFEKNVNGKNVKINASVVEENGVKKAIYTIEGAEGTDFTLALRKPGWCKTPEFILPDAVENEESGYVYLKKDWGEKETVTVILPMEVRFMAADTRVRADIGKVAVMYGPKVFCLEEWDNGKDLQLLSVDPGMAKEKPEVGEITIDGKTDMCLLIPGFRTAPVTESGLYFDVTEEEKTPVTLKYIPYYMWANRGENEMQVWTRKA